ncbi:MAG: hypothetical protein ACKVZJ_04150, partial [Phycisphaerales bacterium]
EPLDPARLTFRRRIGLAPQELALYPELSARENLPVGVQVICPAFEEATMLRVGRMIEVGLGLGVVRAPGV